jgi:monovalent cation:proton antiporter-2 (CPA2) family protein
LTTACIFLGAAAFTVPIANRVGLGSVLGFLCAGLVIGPFGLKLISHPEEVLHFSEFFVVLMLFLIGLELVPSRLWRMRRPILGLGGSQVFLSTLVFFLVGSWLGLGNSEAFAIALGLALSSTAMAIQLLQERRLFKTDAGQSSFSVLLFQDMAVIPMLALIPMLSHTVVSSESSQSGNQALQVILVIAGIIVAGKYLARPLFRTMIAYGNREVFTALVLFLVVGIALLMQKLGLSMALGTFLAGVVLAESEYRHELEISVEPFKGLLLGLFFISVGMSMDLGLLYKHPILFLGLTAGIVLAKFLLHTFLGYRMGMLPYDAMLFAILLSQVGEFAFVLLNFALQFQVISLQNSQGLNLVVALSMVTTPLMLKLLDQIYLRVGNQSFKQAADTINDEAHPVIVPGCGRFGQSLVRLLHGLGIQTTILDNDPNHIEVLRKFGFKVYYGDPTRLETLHAAGAANASMIIICADGADTVNTLVEISRHHYPHLKIYCRARDRRHALQLLHAGVDGIERETFESALKLGERVLVGMGFGSYRARLAVLKFRRHDLSLLHSQVDLRDNEAYQIAMARAERETLEELLKRDDLLHSEEEEVL